MSTDPTNLLKTLGRQSAVSDTAERALEREQRIVERLEMLDAELDHQHHRRRRLSLIGLAVGFAAATAVAGGVAYQSQSAPEPHSAAPAKTTAPVLTPKIAPAAPRPLPPEPPLAPEVNDEPSVAPTPSVGRAHHGAAAPALPESAPPQTRISTLGQENELLASAKAAVRSSDFRTALARIDELLQRYPRSPLGQNAQVERFRVLAKMGQTAQAAQAARRYLADYPQGFARDEARTMAAP